MTNFVRRILDFLAEWGTKNANRLSVFPCYQEGREAVPRNARILEVRRTVPSYNVKTLFFVRDLSAFS